MYIVEMANLDELPAMRPPIVGMREVTLGDLHGNAMKFIYFLLREGIVFWSASVAEPYYRSLMAIYLKDPLALCNADLEMFKKILQSLRKTSSNILVRLIGDEVCDRGRNDALMFFVFEQLRRLSIPIHVVFSNHALSFWSAYELGDFDRSMLGWAQSASMLNFSALIKNKIMDKQEIVSCIMEAYRPALHLLDYSFSGMNITIYTHAPVGLETIALISDKFKIPYGDESADSLSKSIDAINLFFSSVIDAHNVREIFDRDLMGEVAIKIPYAAKNAVACLVFNRDYKNGSILYKDTTHERLYRPKTLKNGDQLTFVHGHAKTLYSAQDNHIHNIDTNFGKSYGAQAWVDVYKVYYSP